MKFLQGLNALWETAISIIPLTAILAAIQMLIFKNHYTVLEILS